MKNKSFIFYDPVHELITIDEKDRIILDLIYSPEFQRMHFIKQLGHLYLVFPGATHSRFIHMLGTYHLAKKLSSDYLSSHLSEYDRQLLLICSLLHDLGHGPFSHTFEFVFQINHEKQTLAIINDKSTKINKILSKFDATLISSINQVFNGTYKNPLIKELISSQIDVDRLDYLLRDSHFTGAKYTSIDTNWLFRSINVKDQKCIFNFSAIYGIEQYLMGRFYMYHQIYLHPRSVCKDMIMRNIFLCYKKLLTQNFNFKHSYGSLNSLVDQSISLSDFLDLNDQTIIKWINLLGQEEHKDLKALSQMYNNEIDYYYYISYDDEQNKQINQWAPACYARKKQNFKYFFDSYYPNKIASYSTGSTKQNEIYILDHNNKICTYDQLLPYQLKINQLYEKKTIFLSLFQHPKLNFKLATY